MEKFEEKFEEKGKDLLGYPAAAILAKGEVWGPKALGLDRNKKYRSVALTAH